ncbi:P-loop containing nucleoside triphosphate hydrolase protein [Aaosphaeria arxii CBS 175.79]|uniref:P-loop containing nucleoside triphosphate hydrolase protein n=1 Tax=Aaosphaeria arxii CBS 175.79 TaxID=1450172 RepID=A0A6A5X7E9_9PLEO|nr:P-loop containing nucleoside triphosphate hydrolase protein [Aaosphaeria arxii CBS 175.79]KAF2008841.1 P-loop containing nucleoside triphosphate hydrolase protein [Aaosphaeria arxii CBS 175.79]
MFARCKAPTWGVDDFSKCFERDYLQTLFPLIVCGVSLLYLLFQSYQAARASKYYHAYSQLDDPRNVWSIRTPHYDANDDADSDTEDELERNERLALRPSLSRNTASTMAVNKPKGEITVVVLEEATVLAALGLHVAIFFTGAYGHKGQIAAIANIATWAYVATLASLRLLLSSTHKLSFPRLWYHTAFIYGFQWVFSVLLFRSALLHPQSKLHQKFAIVDFALITLLFLISLTSRKGNKAVELEYEGDIKPAQEPIASVLSLATFTWVDSIVWTGYKKSYELADVWNLAPKDKAGAVIENYRQVKKTSALAYHLLKHFKRGLLIQGFWAVISGFLTFAPTMLLKAILEYIEAPEYTPRNAAWFYVILLFVSGCASALADGQALWIGRKICIRLRAVVIGEIYAKALKRRVATGADKVLGESKAKAKGEDEEEQPKGIKRIMTFGRKKKKNNEEPGKSTTEDDTAKTGDDESQVTTGAIINLMAVDAFKVSEISAYLHFLWANTPVQVVMAVALLYRILGYSSIAGIGMMVILLPINLYVAKQFSAIQKLILAATDARIHSTNEVLSNIRIIKYFAWEQRFIGVVNDKRYQELAHLKRRYILWAVAATIWSGSPILITFLSFLVYTKVENRDLIPSVAFTALSLFQILRIPLDQLADMIAHVQESKVSVDRIEEYLSEPETDKYSQLISKKQDADGNPVIGFENGTFSWGGKDMTDKASSEAFKLMDLDFEFKVEGLNVVIGPTGSGKTSLLMALLGEMTKLKGSVYLPGGVSREDLKADPTTGLTESVAYCAQQAWLVNGTIRDNIVFASTWNAKRYKDVIEACSLQRDLDILDGGDQTIVGEKGVTLSGGQKQRISLARAMYSKARHVLLDDVLSAVDSHTAKWIFEKALTGPLMRNRTCILVTHNVSLCLPPSDFAIVLDNGRVTSQGTPADVINSGKMTEDLTKSVPASRGASRVPSLTNLNANGEEAADDHHANGLINGDASGPTDTKASPNPYEETKAEGGVKLSIIIMYLKAMGPWYYWIGAAFTFAAQQISSVSTNVWIRQWANSYADKSINAMGHHARTPITHVPTLNGLGTCLNSGTCSWNIPFFSTPDKAQYSYGMMQTSFTANKNDDVNSDYFLGVYAILGLIFMFITFIREGFLFSGSLAASRRVHERLVQAITHAKFRFFDQTPLGQLMNRFSKDIEAVDQEVAPVAIGVVHCLASIITIVILISIITPGFLIAGAFITILYAAIGRFYLSSSRDLKRLESVHRSPLYQQFGETLSGMTTIRAYGDERRFIRENLTKINTQHRPFIYLWAANRWLAFRVDVVGALVSFFAGVFVLRSVGQIDAGAAGLALTYAVTFTENVLWFVRLYSANEQNMNSVERIKEYLDVEQEAAPVIPENRPPANWPSQGSVEFINYSTRYRPDFDKVLKNVTFKILPGEKVGVVGRTGAGKSSLALALFRALEAEEGKILIDEIDVGLIGLQDLRENIVMVPQDPTLFTGTIRSNLDPFGLFTDEEIFQALREVHLISSNTSSATSIASSPERPSTPQQAIEIPNSTSAPIVSDISASFNVGSTTHPSSILANPEWHHANAANDTILAIPSASAASAEQPAGGAAQSDNKNPFRNLNSPVSESGSNLSQGQRQLLCLARALLKAPKVLLMDEATASIDYATDAKIQETIREIKNTTITIAHRLQTIIDYDKVLVLDKGEVIEFGDPWDLLQSKHSFHDMCETSGEISTLEKLAKEAHDSRKKANATA